MLSALLRVVLYALGDFIKMASKGKLRISQTEGALVARAPSAIIAANGITNAKECACFLSALVGDVMTGRVTYGVATAATNSVGKLLKVVEMQLRYGRSDDNGKRELKLLE